MRQPALAGIHERAFHAMLEFVPVDQPRQKTMGCLPGKLESEPALFDNVMKHMDLASIAPTVPFQEASELLAVVNGLRAGRSV